MKKICPKCGRESEINSNTHSSQFGLCFNCIYKKGTNKGAEG